MEDDKIIQLFWQRDEQAIRLAQQRHGPYCLSIARRILRDRQDAEECVNDTFLHAWNSIPPQRPRVLSAFLGRLTRNLSLNRLRHNNAKKRSAATQVLDELRTIVSGEESVEQALQHRELVAAINDFLADQPPQKRMIFVCRYWYFDSVSDIARRCGMSPNRVSVTLSRMRAALREVLLERGFTL